MTLQGVLDETQAQLGDVLGMLGLLEGCGVLPGASSSSGSSSSDLGSSAGSSALFPGAGSTEDGAVAAPQQGLAGAQVNGVNSAQAATAAAVPSPEVAAKLVRTALGEMQARHRRQVAQLEARLVVAQGSQGAAGGAVQQVEVLQVGGHWVPATVMLHRVTWCIGTLPRLSRGVGEGCERGCGCVSATTAGGCTMYGGLKFACSIACSSA